MTSSDGKNGEAKSAEAEAKADNEDDDDVKEPEPQQEQPQEDIKQTIAARLQERLQQVWTWSTTELTYKLRFHMSQSSRDQSQLEQLKTQAKLQMVTCTWVAKNSRAH